MTSSPGGMPATEPQQETGLRERVARALHDHACSPTAEWWGCAWDEDADEETGHVLPYTLADAALAALPATVAPQPEGGTARDEATDRLVKFVHEDSLRAARFRALGDAWQAVDRAIRPLGHGPGVGSNSPWNEGYERAKNEALNAILALRDAAAKGAAPTDGGGEA